MGKLCLFGKIPDLMHSLIQCKKNPKSGWTKEAEKIPWALGFLNRTEWPVAPIGLACHAPKAMTSSKPSYQLPAKEERHEYIRKNFDEIARKYDTFNDCITFGFHRLWKRRILKLANVLEKDKPCILDLCCGSGDVTLLFAKAPLKNATIHAIDFSPEMLQVLGARIQKAQKKGQLASSPKIHEGDAADLSDFAANSVDAVSISFGLRNVQERQKCLQEILRVLKPKGRLVILDVGEVRPAFFAFFHRIFFEKIVPVIGYLVHGSKHEMYAYLPASAKIYPNQDALLVELQEAGFVHVFYETRFLGAAVLHCAEKGKA